MLILSRAIGNRYENEFMALAEALGYATFAARGSRGPIDVLCFEADHPKGCDCGGFDRNGSHDAGEYAGYCNGQRGLRPLAVQVGTVNKGISRTLQEMNEAPRPIGTRLLVARRHRASNRRISWTFHWDEGKSTTLADAI